MHGVVESDILATPSSIPFTLNTSRTTWHKLRGGIDLCLLEYALEDFSVEAFRQAGLLLPPSISHSVPKRQAEYFHGRLAARIALRAAGAIDADVLTGTQREPVWPAGMTGSITHQGPYAGAAVMPASAVNGIGIDIEAPIPDDAREAVEQLAVTASELDALRRLSPLSDPVLLALAFSGKESFYKALFYRVGRFFGFEAVQLTGLDMARGELHFVCQAALTPEWQPGSKGTIAFEFLPDGSVLTSFVW
ncbi:4'-phosphopantetheinyl transferase [Duganella sp. HH105]|uniref:4'-phosphopantetheinyl transferase family protein n=1 Tax=Duganella sp. HH105 TaxID=1781067 RepID=UPI000877BCCF|nr:4'-phosphopantetheinyl transferase superfamily protein [Duganella sp. HH105]